MGRIAALVPTIVLPQPVTLRVRSAITDELHNGAFLQTMQASVSCWRASAHIISHFRARHTIVHPGIYLSRRHQLQYLNQCAPLGTSTCHTIRHPTGIFTLWPHSIFTCSHSTISALPPPPPPPPPPHTRSLVHESKRFGGQRTQRERGTALILARRGIRH